MRRTHGGAIPIPQDEDTEEFLQDSPNRAEKRAIGPAMAERILDRPVRVHRFGVDVPRGGSGPRRAPCDRGDARSAGGPRDFEEAFPEPGVRRRRAAAEPDHMWGPTAIDQLDHIRVNTAVFGANSVMEDGIYASTGYSIELQQKVRSIASTAYFVADSTKFGRNALYKVLGIDAFTAGITDSFLSPISAAAYPIPLIRAEVAQG